LKLGPKFKHLDLLPAFSEPFQWELCIDPSSTRRRLHPKAYINNNTHIQEMISKVKNESVAGLGELLIFSA
jgi:hypothetical protein